MKKIKKTRRRLAVLCVFTISALMIISTKAQIELYDELKDEKAYLENELALLTNDIEELEKEIELVNTDEYIEKIARERLGYVKPNEFIFKEVQ